MFLDDYDRVVQLFMGDDGKYPPKPRDSLFFTVVSPSKEYHARPLGFCEGEKPRIVQIRGDHNSLFRSSQFQYSFI